MIGLNFDDNQQDYDNEKVQHIRNNSGAFNFDEEPNICTSPVETRPMVLLQNHAKYEGQWIPGQDIKQGKGTQTWPDGSVYDGWWHDNKANGQGRLIHVDGDVYHGHWLDDKAHGYGIYDHYDGARYQGQWEEDM